MVARASARWRPSAVSGGSSAGLAAFSALRTRITVSAQGAGNTSSRPARTRPAHRRVVLEFMARLLAEEADLGLALVVDIHSEIVEVADHFVQVVGSDLAQIEGHAVLLQSRVHAVARLLGDQAGQLHSGAQHLQRHADRS